MHFLSPVPLHFHGLLLSLGNVAAYLGIGPVSNSFFSFGSKLAMKNKHSLQELSFDRLLFRERIWTLPRTELASRSADLRSGALLGVVQYLPGRRPALRRQCPRRVAGILPAKSGRSFRSEQTRWNAAPFCRLEAGSTLFRTARRPGSQRLPRSRGLRFQTEPHLHSWLLRPGPVAVRGAGRTTLRESLIPPQLHP